MLKHCKRGHAEEGYINTRGVAECRPCRLASKAKYREAHRTEAREYYRRRRSENLDAERQRMRDYMKAKRRDDPEWVRESCRRWRKNHPEQSAEKGRLWREANPAKVRAIRALYKARKRTTSIGVVDMAKLIAMANGICGICTEAIEGQYHIDHIMPLSKGGKHIQDNLQVTHPSCNLRKSNKVPDYV